MRTKIVAGNWKMNLHVQEARDLFEGLIKNVPSSSDRKVIIAPPSIYLSEFSLNNKNSSVALAAQNCSEHENGAFTGEISASMLHELGVLYCIVGHSERRQYQKESNLQLKNKVNCLLLNNVAPIYCCGESLEERENGEAFNVVQRQISEALFHLSDSKILNVVIAYEPIWAIGTGITASAEQAQEMHTFIRANLITKYGEEIGSKISILYGGSCKPDNAKELFSKDDIDGGLIGGASLQLDSFMGIILS